ncbi:MAG: hypothetical protein NC223_11760 [Butyrivibrio sp.]|nr:hypothetical protein [Butyrivibrio sp.]
MLLAAAPTLGLLSGCAENKNVRRQATAALWSDRLTEQYGEFLRDKFSEAIIVLIHLNT